MKKATVISLLEARLRREHIDKQFKKLDIDYKFFDAVNKSQAENVCHNFNIKHVENITQGELGCFMSHLSIWQEMIGNNESYCIVFEDDVVLSVNIKDIFHNLNDIMKACEIVKLETMLFPVLLGNRVFNIKNYDLYSLKSEHMGMAGYVISLKAAKHIINNLQREGINKPIDHYLFKEDLFLKENTFQIVPAVVIQDNVLNKDATILRSQIESERQDRRRQVKKHLSSSQKINREIKRLLNQLNPHTWIIKIKDWLESRKKVIVKFE